MADVEEHGQAAEVAQREEHDQGGAPEPAPGEQVALVHAEAGQVITLKGVSLPPQGAEGGL